ncbi:glycosyltransferase involved in cell wall biosynthesis [Pedobacter sp. CAN_A7]|uniref:glycosyltransferase family 4 protein n=1 Tax=Pedobacter sp. CAN_A7 TaxID=2787722 RepID=UPI0018CB6334
MNILVANWTWYPSGGDWTYVEHITKLYREHGHQVIPFSMKDNRNFPSPYAEYFIEHIDYKKVNKKSLTDGLKVVKTSIYSTEAQNKLERLLDVVKIDFAHINVIHHYITPAILKTLKKRGIPIIWTLHEYTPICPESTFISHGKICEKCFGGAFHHCVTNKCKKGSLPASIVASMENYVHKYLNYYEYVDHYICPSVFLYEKFKQFNFFKEKLVQLYHGYDYKEIAEARSAQHATAPVQERFAQHAPIVFVGRLEKIKGAHTLLEAMKAHPTIPLKIIGTGTQLEMLQTYAKINQLIQVDFLGKKTKKETLEWIGKSAFLVCPSEWYEVLGFTVVEAMAMGKPVIGSKIGAIPEMVIDGRTGLLFEAGNSNQLAEKINELYHDLELQQHMGGQAEQHIHQLINSEKHYAGLQQINLSL